MYIKKQFLLIAILLVSVQALAQNKFSDYEIEHLKFVASGESSSTSISELGTAQNELGIRYANGSKGVSKNIEEAAFWFLQGASNGNKYAQNNIAWRYYEGYGVTKDLAEALYWFDRSGKQNFYEAALMAGKMYFYGEGTEVNYYKALRCFKNAAFGDIPEGKYYYGMCFAFGYGTEVDPTKALIWANRAIEDEYYSSYWTLGRMYSRAEGVEWDFEKAEYYFRMGVKHKISNCANDLGIGYEKGTFVEKDINKAFEYYTLAASQGNRYGKSNLARLYKNPDNSFYNPEKAELWYKSLIEDGYIEYELDLIDIYETTGKKGEVFKIYRRRANEGDTSSMNSLAYMYVKGEGTIASLEKAIETIDNAIKKEPSNLNFLDTKGEVYLISGDIKKAAKIWKIINKKNPHFYDKATNGYKESSLNKYFLANPIK